MPPCLFHLPGVTIALQESSRSWFFFQEIEWRRVYLKPDRSRSFFLIFELPKQHWECVWTREGCRLHETVKSLKILKKEEGLLSSKVIRKGVWAWVCAVGGRGALLQCSEAMGWHQSWSGLAYWAQNWSVMIPFENTTPKEGKGLHLVMLLGEVMPSERRDGSCPSCTPCPHLLAKVLLGFDRAFPECLILFPLSL